MAEWKLGSRPGLEDGRRWLWGCWAELQTPGCAPPSPLTARGEEGKQNPPAHMNREVRSIRKSQLSHVFGEEKK